MAAYALGLPGRRRVASQRMNKNHADLLGTDEWAAFLHRTCCRW